MFDHELGGVKTPRKIIDQQRGPECGYEAVENVVQLVYPFGNNVSEKDLKRRAAFYGFSGTVGGQSVLDPRGYQKLLADYGIASTWSSFNADTLIQALRENRVAVVIVDAAILDPKNYPPSDELHAIVVTNFGVNSQNTVVRYTGIDSNFGGTERHWRWDRLHNAVAAAGFKILITETCIAQKYWETYHVLTRVSGGIRVASSATP
jgi:hypothetical protein